MTKRKLDGVITDSTQTNTIVERSYPEDNAKKYSTHQSSCMSTTTELYCNKNIKLILLYHMQDKAIDVNIFDSDVNKEKAEEQCNKQQKKLIKKLKFECYAFGSSQLIEKFYIFGRQDHNALITAALIIRFYKKGIRFAITVNPLIDFEWTFEIYRKIYEDYESNEIFIYTFSFGSSEILTKSEGIDICKFIEVIKLQINNTDNAVSIEEDIKRVMEVPSNDYKITHQEIVDKYKLELPNNKGKDNDSSEEDEMLDVIDHHIKDTIEHQDEIIGVMNQITDTIELEEIIHEAVEQLITRVVKKTERGGKKLSWDISVIDNEGKTRNNKEVARHDQEAIELFARALKYWDVELFKQAREKSKDFVKLIDYFDEEIKYEFLGHFNGNVYYKSYFDKENDYEKRAIIKQEYNNFLLKTLNGYEFLINSIPNLFDKFKQKQASSIRSLPESREQCKSCDLIELIECKLHNYTDQQLIKLSSSTSC